MMANTLVMIKFNILELLHVRIRRQNDRNFKNTQ